MQCRRKVHVSSDVSHFLRQNKIYSKCRANTPQEFCNHVYKKPIKTTDTTAAESFPSFQKQQEQREVGGDRRIEQGETGKSKEGRGKKAGGEEVFICQSWCAVFV